MEQITIKGKIEFCDKYNQEYNREFSATLHDSAASGYGNKTAVIIVFGLMANGRTCDTVLIDTRYDRTIKRNETDFKEWIRTYFKEHYAKHVLTIY